MRADLIGWQAASRLARIRAMVAIAEYYSVAATLMGSGVCFVRRDVLLGRFSTSACWLDDDLPMAV